MQPDDDIRPALKPPQFRLTTLLLVVALVCAVLAMLATTSLPLLIVVSIFVLAVVLHVVGAKLGGSLRRNGSEKSQHAATKPRELQPDDFAPTTGLSRREGSPIITVAATIAGAILFGSIGCAVLCYIHWQNLTWLAAIAAATASGVLGGIIGFGASGFILVLVGMGLETHRRP